MEDIEQWSVRKLRKEFLDNKARVTELEHLIEDRNGMVNGLKNVITELEAKLAASDRALELMGICLSNVGCSGCEINCDGGILLNAEYFKAKAAKELRR